MTQREVRTTAGRRFEAEGNESILDAALRAGVVLPYSCRTGRCSTCRGKLRQGSTTALHEELGLSADERAQGFILTCVRAVATDVEIDIQDLGNLRLYPAKVLPARIAAIERFSEDVVKVQLRLPPTADFRWHAGQYIDVIGQGGLRRSYSLANAQDADKLLELHVSRVPGGAMSRYWFEAAKANDLLRINGPLGTFFLREIEGLDVVFLATGTGIAPVKAMLESLQLDNRELRPKSVTVLWGGRTAAALYWDPTRLATVFEYVPVLSQAPPDWRGARGYVQQALLERGVSLGNAVVYACGSDAMIHSAMTLLCGRGLPERRFQSDAFVPSGDA